MSEIIVYSSDTCPYCTYLKEYLNEKNVEFIERNITKDMEARKELMNMGHMGVPVTIVEGQEVVGFDQAKLDQLLKL